ncbi:MAG: HAD family hydrolase [Deltaproteobacteria bacterium]|jgi:FMN phosphatase YigB (HAD superfamily)|nr:HAD family hydrolase [Deltaproteobacteria bacterium]
MTRFNQVQVDDPYSLDLANVEFVLFDLDGTLVEVDMHAFVPAYLNRLADRLSFCADPKRISQVFRQVVTEMVSSHDGCQTMEERLISGLKEYGSIGVADYHDGLSLFIRHDLAALRPLVKAHPLARDLVEASLARGWTPVLATNPIFPQAVIEARLTWGGLADLPFALVTAYETSRYCKPQPGYFSEVMSKLNASPEKALMIGNDTFHDLSASQIGIQTCLLTPWRIDRNDQSFSADWEGTHADLLALLGQSVETKPSRPGPN